MITLQAIQYEKLNSPKLFKRKYRFHLGEFSNTSFAVSEAERVKKPLSNMAHRFSCGNHTLLQTSEAKHAVTLFQTKLAQSGTAEQGHSAFKCYPDGNLIGNRAFAAQPLTPPYFDQLILNRTCAREHVAESMLLVVQIKCVLSEGVERYFCPNPIF